MVLFKNGLKDNRLFFIFSSSASSLFFFSVIMTMSQSVYADSNFGAAGDYGCTSNTDATFANMKGKNPERVFALGDYSYSPTGTCFFNKIDPTGLTGITKIAIGNHEDDDSEAFSIYMSHFGQSQTYFSYNYDTVHVLVMDTDRNPYSSGSAQYNFVVNDLQSASQNPNIKWIIVYLHKPFFTSPNSCSSSGCTNTGSVATDLRNIYESKFDQFGVDLVLQGHVHNYQRTFPLKYDPGSPSSPTITSTNANTYTEGNGVVFAIVGTGGQGIFPFSNKASFVSKQHESSGQLDIKITNSDNKLEGTFYKNGNNNILDSFSITKAGNSAPVANNQIVTTTKNTAKAITLAATDANNDPLTYSIVTPPSHGTVTGGTGPSRTYTSATDYVGPDSFTFKANDGNLDSNTATVSITVQDTGSGSCATNLPISGVTASGSSGSSTQPSNVLDNNLNTKWANNGVGSSIRSDLGSVQNICSVSIAWGYGNVEAYHFVIATSTDGTTFTNKFSGDSSGATLNSENYPIPATGARYLRISVNGNTDPNFGTWANMAELDVFGSSSAALSSLYNYGPSLSLSGPTS